MIEISKHDWKLFRERIVPWQESYIEKLDREYIALLESEMPASQKFWQLEKRIREDKRKPGVLLQLRKSEVVYDIARLIQDGAITEKDLDGFSQDLKDKVALHLPHEEENL